MVEPADRVAGRLQQPRHRNGVCVQPVRHVAFRIAGHPSKMPIDVKTRRKLPGHYRRSAGRTNTAGNCEPVEVGSLLRQPINVRCLNIGMTMTAKITPTPVIGKDEHDVGLCSATFSHANAGRVTRAMYISAKIKAGTWLKCFMRFFNFDIFCFVFIFGL